MSNAVLPLTLRTGRPSILGPHARHWKLHCVRGAWKPSPAQAGDKIAYDRSKRSVLGAVGRKGRIETTDVGWGQLGQWRVPIARYMFG